jgi:molybdenum cofactor biosynthesis enzyme MoaA
MPDGNHPRTLLPFETFVHMYEQFRRYAEHLTLIGGEPLLYPWITQVLELVARDPVAVTINTNATALTEKLTRVLLTLHRLELKCSFDAATRNTYKQIRGLDIFDRVMINIERFSKAANCRPEIKLIFHYVVMRQNLEEVLPFVALMSRFRPYRLEFLPVRHVSNWQVSNETGWVFRGRDQCCEYFKDEYNDVMRQAAAACEANGLGYEVLYL